ncbi:MAG: hypothetical protein P4L57_05755 [Rhizomicrobium sp.]|nr:hypothetical protein [Rhizomicrobium sp.]
MNRATLNTPRRILLVGFLVPLVALWHLSNPLKDAKGASKAFALVPGWEAYISAVGVALLIAAAAALVGIFAGFLLGLPRHAPTASDAKAVAQDNSYGTNLEQISDWLTKILLGAGLTQITSISEFIWKTSDGAAKALNGIPGVTQIFAAEMIFFSVAGLWYSYLWTRFYVGPAFAEAERISSLKQILSQREKESRADSEALSTVGAQLTGQPDEIPTQDQLNAAIVAASTDTRALIYFRAQRTRIQSLVGGDDASKRQMERTIPVFRALIASDSDRLYASNHAQLACALKDSTPPKWEEAEAEFSEAILIRDKCQRPAEGEQWLSYEANRAICRINLDQKFKTGAKADPSWKQKIVDDLKVAKADASWPSISKEAAKWAAVNEVDLNALDKPAAN